MNHEGSDAFSRLKSIAVLPFANMASDKENEFLPDSLYVGP